MSVKNSASILTLLAVGALPSGAFAQAANTTTSNDNILNLLSPFLSLNATTDGQQTLTANLAQAIATNNNATAALQALAVSDKNLFGGRTNTITLANGTTMTYGIAANLAGGLPAQAAVTPSAGATTTTPTTPIQAIGALGSVLGPAYQRGVAPIGTGAATTAILANTATLLNTGYTNFTSADLGVAKFYFANGTINGTTAAVAAVGSTLPTANGLPNKTNSVYDLAYGVSNTGANQDIYGSSRPVQVAPMPPNGINQFDSTSITGLTTNPSFPSGHTTYAYTDSLLLAMLVPQDYQNFLTRASEYANSRIVLGVHYPLDIIASRALATYDLSQAFTNAAYQGGGATAAAFNLPTLFNAANGELQPYLTVNSGTCGGTIAACSNSAASANPYTASAANAAAYTANLTYGLPTLTLAQAPQEALPVGGADPGILLAPLYGGSTAAAKAIVLGAGLDGTLSSATIDQILQNTENNALAAFYGTSLSYYTRLNLYAAAGYFTNVTGTLSLSPTDSVVVPVTVGAGGVLDDNGTLTGGAATVTSTGTLTGSGSVTGVNVNAGGTLAPGSLAAQAALRANGTAVAGTRLTVNGNVGLAAGSTLGLFATSTQVTSLAATGTANVAGANVAVLLPATTAFAPFNNAAIVTATGGVTGAFAAATTNFPFLAASLSYDANDVFLSVARNGAALVAAGGTTNQIAVARGLAAASAAPSSAVGSTILNTVFAQTSVAQARATFDNLSGEGVVAAQNVANRSVSEFTSSIFDQTTFYGAGTTANSITLGTATAGFQALRGAEAVSPIHELADLPSSRPAPIPPVFVQRTWRAWATGFGGGETFQANGTTGTAGLNDTIYGGTLGVDYQLTPDALVGVAVGGSNGDFNVGARATSGSTTGGHVALYDFVTFGRYYGAASLSGSFFDNKTTRNVAGFGGLAGETERGRFGSQEIRTRLEAGRQFASFNGFLTPFVAIEAAGLRSDGFSETNVSGPTVLGLAVQGQTRATVPGFLGARFQTTTAIGNGLILVPTIQVAYVHDFSPQRSETNALINLPGATFLVDGARPSYNSAQVKAGAELIVGAHSVLFANFDGEFSGRDQFYGGKGGLRYVW